MSVNLVRLAGPVQIAAVPTSYYLAAAVTRLDKVTVSNPSNATAYQVTFWVVPAGGAANGATQMINQRNLLPLATIDIQELIGHDLNIGDALWAQASAAVALNLLLSGTQVS